MSVYRYVDEPNPTPEFIRRWLDGEITTDEALRECALDPRPGVQIWAQAVREARAVDPKSFVRLVNLA